MPDDRLSATIETYERVADEYADRHADRTEIAPLLESFLDRLEPNSRIADVGCGPGWESEAMTARGHDVVGIDRSPSFCRQTYERDTVGAVRGDMRSLPLEDGAFDGLWSCASFLHVPRSDADATLATFERSLRSGGTLFLLVKRGTGTRDGDGYEDDRRRFTLYEPGELRTRLERAGFTVDSMTTTESWVQVLATANGA